MHTKSKTKLLDLPLIITEPPVSLFNYDDLNGNLYNKLSKENAQILSQQRLKMVE